MNVSNLLLTANRFIVQWSFIMQISKINTCIIREHNKDSKWDWSYQASFQPRKLYSSCNMWSSQLKKANCHTLPWQRYDPSLTQVDKSHEGLGLNSSKLLCGKYSQKQHGRAFVSQLVPWFNQPVLIELYYSWSAQCDW